MRARCGGFRVVKCVCSFLMVFFSFMISHHDGLSRLDDEQTFWRIVYDFDDIISVWKD